MSDAQHPHAVAEPDPRREAARTMRQVMVRYKVKPDRVAENEELIRAVYEELKRTDPAGLRYATFRLDDGVTFVHLASHESDDGRSPLADVEAFRRFQEHIEDRVDEGPVVTELSQIGSFHLLEDPSRS